MKRFLSVLLLVIALVSPCEGQVIFVGGWKTPVNEMESFADSISEKRLVINLPKNFFDLMSTKSCSEYIFQQINQSVDIQKEEITIIAYSWGGVTTRIMLENHKELRVKKFIIVGSPVGGFWFAPSFLFSATDRDDIPVYLIAGNIDGKGDGTIPMDSVFSVPSEHVKDFEIFDETSHTELLHSSQVASKIKS